MHNFAGFLSLFAVETTKHSIHVCFKLNAVYKFKFGKENEGIQRDKCAGRIVTGVFSTLYAVPLIQFNRTLDSLSNVHAVVRSFEARINFSARSGTHAHT